MRPKVKIAIASGKGGTGKTFISTNLFRVLEKTGVPVHLVDCDAEEPNDREFLSGEACGSTNIVQQIPEIDTDKCSFCGLCYDYCNYNAILYVKSRNFIEVLEDQCHGCGACTYACKFDAITEKEDVLGTVKEYKRTEISSLFEARMKVGVHSPVPIIKAAIQSVNANFAILDSPPGTSCPFIQTVAPADFVVLVTEPTPFGLSDLKQAVETLKTLGKPCGVIVNRSSLGTNEVYSYLEEEKIPLLMSVPFEKEIAYNYSRGKLIVDENQEWTDKFVQLYNQIVANIWN